MPIAEQISCAQARADLQQSEGSIHEVRSKVAEGSGRRRVLAAATSVLCAGFVLSASAATVAARPDVALRHLDTAPRPTAAGAVGDGGGSHATVSGDGRYVAFQGVPGGVAGVPVADGDNRSSTIYLTDREVGVTTELTPVPEGRRAGNSRHPVLSGDGCTVVVVTELALDVFRDDDTGERWDVYRTRLGHCDGAGAGWELVSTGTDGNSLARDDVRADSRPAVSRNGTVIAYTHPATQLFDGGAGLTSVTVVDLAIPLDNPDRSVLAAGMPLSPPSTQFVHAGLDQPALSGDGRFLAYRSDAASSEAVASWGQGPVPGGPATRQVFVWDRAEPDPFLAVRLVSARPDGTPAPAGASEPALSRDGRIVAFTSADPGLAPAVFPVCADGCPSQVFRLDRDADENGWLDEANRTTMTLVSSEPGTNPVVAGVAPSSQPALSGDGQLVAFVTKAPNLQLVKASGGGEPTDGDLLVADARLGGLRRVALSADGTRPPVGAHARPQMSDTGRTTVFDTLAAVQLVPGAAPGRQVVAMTTEPTLSLADADLGTTLVGLQSDEWYVAVINEGPTSFSPSEITVSDNRFEINRLGSTCALYTAVPPGADCTVKLTFTPRSPGPVSATLTVAETGFQAVSVSSRVSGSGGDPTLRADPGGADLGVVAVGASSPEFQFDVQNISLAPTSVASVRVVGAHAGDFAVTSDSCIDRPLNPRSTCSIGVTFSPTAPGRRAALVQVETSTGEYTTLVAAGDARYAPQLILPADEVDAGRSFIAGGSGYPANAQVSIAFDDSSGPMLRVATNDDGIFIVEVPVGPSERGGRRVVVVQASDGTVASATIDVVEHDSQMVGLPGFGLG
jgi:hypothetical protein